MPTLNLNIAGKVQGVGYRRWFEQQANALEVYGYVRNCSNGDVEAIVVGSFAALQTLVKSSMQGPNYAQVTHVDYRIEAENQMFEDFQIRF